jgi:hypothetical protein
MRMIMNRDRPLYITGTEIEVEIPFTGEADAFKIQPNPHPLNPPRAVVRSGKLTFSVVGTNLDTDDARRQINQAVSQIQSHLANLKSNASGLNDQLLGEARAAIAARRSKLLTSQNMVASLGFKMKERDGAAKTFTAPEVRRKIAPIMPQASTAPFKPEPAMADTDYDHILGLLENMTQVMELSPSAFHTLGEEALRTHFLVQLNSQYQGQATGETFNYEGKTDILVRSNGKNIFIAECKFWSGAKNLSATIDQLLSYNSWRDTKTAIVVFNRNRDFSKVLAAIPEAVRLHPQYKRDLPGSSESSFRYQFANRDDRNRELFLTVLAFNVPTPRE